MSVRLEGMQKAEEAGRKLVRTAVFHLNSAGGSMVTLSSELAPRSDVTDETHLHMADAIKQTEEADAGHLRVAVESPKEYSAFVEFGTVNMDAQPFFTPAFESVKRQLFNVREIF